jgi:hypothetical protein
MTKLLTGKRRRDASGVAFVGLGEQQTPGRGGKAGRVVPSPQQQTKGEPNEKAPSSVDDIFAQLLG